MYNVENGRGPRVFSSPSLSLNTSEGFWGNCCRNVPSRVRFRFFFSWLQPKPAIHGLGPLPRETRHISRFEIYLGAEVAGSTSSGRDGRRGRDSCHLKRNGSVARAPVYGGLQRRRQKVLVGPPVDFRGSEENILFLKNVSLRKLHDKI